MFNIEEGSNQHREAVFQRRIKMMQQAYRDGFFDEGVTTPMPVIATGGDSWRKRMYPEDKKKTSSKEPPTDDLAVAWQDSMKRRKEQYRKPARGYEPPTATEDPPGSYDDDADDGDPYDGDPCSACGCAHGSSEKYCKHCCLWFMVAEAEVYCPRCQAPLWEPSA